MRHFKLIFVLILLTCLANAQPYSYSIPGAVYTQDFNQLPLSINTSLAGKGPHSLHQPPILNTGLTGWQIMQLSGNQSNTTINSSTGSSTGSGVYSYGLSGNNNRALGTLASGTGVYAIGMVLDNKTGIILNRVSISFIVTQWRKGGSSNRNQWQFGYQTGLFNDINTNTLKTDTSLNFQSIHTTTGAATLNGHLPANQYVLSVTIENILWLPDQQLVLRWDDIDEGGSDDGMAIDDFRFSAFQQITIPAVNVFPPEDITPTSATLKAMINDGLANSSIAFEYDTSDRFHHAISINPLSTHVLPSGTGDTLLWVTVASLASGTTYYFRALAQNHQGQRISDTITFQTPKEPPRIQLDSIQILDTHYKIFASIDDNNTDTITEAGICWSLDSLPDIQDRVIISALTDRQLSLQLDSFPYGTIVFVRAYAISNAGIGYSNSHSFHTPTHIRSFLTSSPTLTNLDTIHYRLRLEHPVEGIQLSNFALMQEVSGTAQIISLTTKNKDEYLLTVHTGDHNTSFYPIFQDHLANPRIMNSPFAGNKIIVDKKPPLIKEMYMADRAYKVGDTITIMIKTAPDSSSVTLIGGAVAGHALTNLVKQNDSCLSVMAIVSSKGKEVKAEEPIPVTIRMQDKAGNKNEVDSFFIFRAHGAIDMTRPAISNIRLTGKKWLKAGDSLLLSVITTEPVICDTLAGKPVLSVTIGTRIRNPFLYHQTDSVLQFLYIIQPDELDMDGIRIANTLTLNNAIIHDWAGNILTNQIPNARIMTDVNIDAVLPFVNSVTTPAPITYRAGDSLSFIVHLSKQLLLNDTILPHLELTIGSQTQKAVYESGLPGRTAAFVYVVPNGIADKNGIQLTGIIFNNKEVRDSAGNQLLPSLKSIGALGNVNIDGITPSFILGPTVQKNVCINSITAIESLLGLYNEEKNETITWSITQPPQRGNILGLPFTYKSGSNTLTPGNIYYTPDTQVPGWDSCTIEVSDGVNRVYQTIYFNIHETVRNNIIETSQVICSGTKPGMIAGSEPTGGTGSFQYQWITTSVKSPVNFQNINHSFASYQPGNLNSPVILKRVVQSGGCTDSSNSVTIDVTTKGLWIGKQNTNWHIGSNWCGGLVPDQNTDVLIHHATVSVTDSAFCRSIQVRDSAGLHITGILSYSGSIHATASIEAMNGTIAPMGKQEQQLSGNVFRHQTIGNLVVGTPSLTLTDSLFIQNGFAITKGLVNSNGFLILNTNAGIYSNAPGSRVTGKIGIHKSLNHSKKHTWFTHPLHETIPIVESPVSSDEVFSTILSGSLASLEMNEPKPGKEVNNTSKQELQWRQWQTPKAWDAGKGVKIVATDSVSHWYFSGTPIMTEYDINYPATTDTSYVLTGNPYLSSVLTKHLSKTEGIGNFFWVWDNNLAVNGGYAVKSFHSNHVLEPLQGFLIKSLPQQLNSIRFHEQSRISQPLPDSLLDIIENTHQLELSMYQEDQLLDRLLILNSDTSSSRFEASDAEKLFNKHYNLYSLSWDQVPLAIDSRSLNNKTFIPIGLTVAEEGQYHLRFNRIWLHPHLQLELHDLFTGAILRIGQDSIYRFRVTSDTATKGEQRFVIRAPLPPPPQEEPIMMKIYPVPAHNHLRVKYSTREEGNGYILIKSLQGQVLKSTALGIIKEGETNISLQGLIKGQYILELHCGRTFIANTFIKL